MHLEHTIGKIPVVGCMMLINAGMGPGLFDGVHLLTYADARTMTALVDEVLGPMNSRRIQAMRQRVQAIVLRRHVVTHRAAEMHASLQ